MEKMIYQLVPMNAELIPAVAELERLCFSHPWSENALREELFNDTVSFIVAVTETGEVIGYAGLHCILDEGYIDNVAVKLEYRRQGVASELLGAFMRFAQVHLSFLTLEVRASNNAAIALYEKYGFQIVGRRKDYYSSPKEDAILMTWEVKHEAETNQSG